MIYKRENLKVVEIVKEMKQYYFGEELKKLEIKAMNEEYEVNLTCDLSQLGTYKDNNVKKIANLLEVDKEFDLVEGEQGYGINLNLKRKAYYSKDCYFMPDQFRIEERKRV